METIENNTVGGQKMCTRCSHFFEEIDFIDQYGSPRKRCVSCRLKTSRLQRKRYIPRPKQKQKPRVAIKDVPHVPKISFPVKIKEKSQIDKKQDIDDRTNICNICGRKNVKLVIDHNHNNGKIRGKLCYSCNLGLGMFKDSIKNMQRAIEYLQTDNLEYLNLPYRIKASFLKLRNRV